MDADLFDVQVRLSFLFKFLRFLLPVVNLMSLNHVTPGKQKKKKARPIYTIVQKKRDSYTCSFLALTYWFNLNLMSILKKFSLFPTKPYFCFYCATHNKQMDEISKFQVEKKVTKMHPHAKERRLIYI